MQSVPMCDTEPLININLYTNNHILPYIDHLSTQGNYKKKNENTL